jgi:hypothetical protein
MILLIVHFFWGVLVAHATGNDIKNPWLWIVLIYPHIMFFVRDYLK